LPAEEMVIEGMLLQQLESPFAYSPYIGVVSNE
jgi:hypothetical protein